MTMRNRKYVAALLVLALTLTAGPALGAELRVDGQQEFGTEVELAWTLRVDYKMTFRDADDQGKPKGWVVSIFVVTAQQDMPLEVRTSPIIDDRGASYPLPQREDWTYYFGGIGGVGGSTQRLVAGVPTQIVICHLAPERREFPTFARMKFWFNGREVELRNVKTQTKAAWRRVEAELEHQRQDAYDGAADTSL